MTIKDIAKLAGVSAMTVSNVIHHKRDKVSQATFEKVSDIIDANHFSISQNASTLKSKKSHLIGLLYYTEVTKIKFTNPFVASVLSGIEDVSKDLGFFVMVHAISDINDLVVLQRTWQFAGFIVVGLQGSNFDAFDCHIDIPVVYVDTLITEAQRNFKKHSFVEMDEVAASKKAMQYLIAQGHQKIGFLSYPFDAKSTGVLQSRFKGYQDYVADINHFIVGSDNEVSKLTIPDSITAILATSDILALEIWKKYPMLSVIGFDDILILKYLSPALTTTKIDQKRKGENAILALMDLITTKNGRLITIESELVIRDSVKNLNEI